MTRLAPKFTVIRRILALSGNQCAFPDCNNSLIFDGVFVGELAHIYAAETGGPRFNISMNDEQRRDFPNLVYLCAHHHTIIDKKELIDKYTPEWLIKIKSEHEAKNKDTPFSISDDIIEQALEQINIVQANVLMSGNQTNIQQNFIGQSATEASHALSEVIANTQMGKSDGSDISEDNTDDGILDRMANAEVTIPLWTNTINSLGEEIKKITPVLNQGTADIHHSDKMNKGLSGRIHVFKKTAENLDPISTKIETLGKLYAEQFTIVDGGINAILDTVEIDPMQAKAFKSFFEIMIDMVQSSTEGIAPVDDMLEQMSTLEKMSSGMKRTLTKMRVGLALVSESRPKIEMWAVRIKSIEGSKLEP